MAVAAQYLEIVDREGLPILGESEGHDYVDSIDITGWEWNVTDSSATKSDTSSGSGNGATAGSAKASAGGAEVGIDPAQFTFRKVVDASTTRLMTAMYRGEVLQQATFTLLEEVVSVKNERRGAFRLHVVLENAIVVGYQLDGRASEFRVDLDETWTLNYSKISFLYETERMNAEFDRTPGSKSRGSGKRDPTFLEQLRKYGIVPEQYARGRGKRE